MQDKDILVHLEDVANEIRTALPRAVPGMAVSIGFFGTVFGLFMGIYAMPGLFQGNALNSEEGFQLLTLAMVGALDGMKTAFGTTIVGLIISLILTMGNLVYRAFWDRYDLALKRVTTLWIYPVFIIPEQENIINRLIEIMNESSETLKIIGSGNSRLLGSMDSLAENMGAYNRENEKIIKQVSTVVKEFMASQKGSKEAFESMKNIGEQTHKSYMLIQGLLETALQDREEFLAYLQDSRQEIREISTMQHNAYVEANREFSRDQQKLQSEARDSMMKSYDEFQQYLKGVNEKFMVQNSELMESTRKTIELIFGKMAETVEKTDGAFSKNLSEMKMLLEDFKTQILGNNEAYESETKKLIGKLSGIIEKIVETNSMYIA
jgi:hypothetical protein